MNKDIAVFYHVYCGTNWEDVYLAQLRKLVDSKLIIYAKIIIVIVGDDYDYSVARTLTPADDNIELFHEPENNFEYSTLHKLQKYAEYNDAFILYMHSKGTGNPQNMENQTAWREYMEYFTIENYQDCINALVDGFDIVGVNYFISPEGVFTPHFSGNFWWTHSDYVKKLPLLLKPKDYENFKRTIYEFWIGLADHKVKCLHTNGNAFYTTKIERHEYRRYNEQD